MAGAQRVEGCLFGNGERCGNMDIVTMALNLYTQGVHPQLDFSNITAVARVAEECTGIPSTRATRTRATWCSPRSRLAPGRDQERLCRARPGCAVGSALPAHRPGGPGRTYDSVIRVNSQSGKGGIAFLLEREHGVVMPGACRWSSAPWCSAHRRERNRDGRRACGNCSRPPTCAAPGRARRGATRHRLDDGQGIELDVAIDGPVRQTLRGRQRPDCRHGGRPGPAAARARLRGARHRQRCQRPGAGHCGGQPCRA